MTRSYSLCGRCGRSGHGWGETNDYGMLRCPLAQGAGERAHNKDDNMEGRRKEHQRKRRMRKQGHSLGDEADISHEKLVKKLSGSSRWSKSISQKMRGGTPCTVGSLSSLLLNMASRDARLESAALQQSKQFKTSREGLARRPLTAEPLHQYSPRVPVPRTRPSTSASTQASHSYLHAKTRFSCEASTSIYISLAQASQSKGCGLAQRDGPAWGGGRFCLLEASNGIRLCYARGSWVRGRSEQNSRCPVRTRTAGLDAAACAMSVCWMSCRLQFAVPFQCIIQKIRL